MKLKSILSLVALSTILFSACKPIYRCGDIIPEKKNTFWGSRLKKVVGERDTLCLSLSVAEEQVRSLEEDTIALSQQIRSLEKDSTTLGEQVRNLTEQNQNLANAREQLQKNYDELQNEKLSEAESFNRALKQKVNELSEKEQLLVERENKLKELQDVISRQDSISKRLHDVLHDALMGFNSDELSVEMRNGKVYISMSDKLLFSSGSANIETKGVEALNVLADVLIKNPETEILVEGHTDNVPIKTAVFKDNWDLSVARATSIVRILTNEHAILPTRITASGRGEHFPKGDNTTAEGRALNRRTEIILSPKLDVMMELLEKK